MSEHTPTPWRRGENSFGTQFIYGNLDQPRTSPMGVKYNDLVAGGDHPGTLTEANATLIINAVNGYDSLLRRVTVLEMVIRQDLSPFDCSDDLNKMIVEDIHARFSVPALVGSLPGDK
jgi:hypothetical protein